MCEMARNGDGRLRKKGGEEDGKSIELEDLGTCLSELAAILCR